MGVCSAKFRAVVKVNPAGGTAEKRSANLQSRIRSKNDAIGIDEEETRRPVGLNQTVEIGKAAAGDSGNDIVDICRIVEKSGAVRRDRKRFKTVK